MFVKICGITRMADAMAALDGGADAIGFIFWPGSQRWIEPQDARAITDALPPSVMAVGVFVDQPADYVNDVAEIARLGAVQLHGGETVEYSAMLRRPVLKALTFGNAPDAEIDRWPATTTVLLDAHDPVRRGGTGKTIDWTRAAAIASRRRIILAGGLTPQNVANAIDCVQPFGIDVSSGVESAPGVKDAGKIRALFDAVRQARFTAELNERR